MQLKATEKKQEVDPDLGLFSVISISKNELSRSWFYVFFPAGSKFPLTV